MYKVSLSQDPIPYSVPLGQILSLRSPVRLAVVFGAIVVFLVYCDGRNSFAI